MKFRYGTFAVTFCSFILFINVSCVCVNCCRATGFTTRSDIGPARDADDIPYVLFVCLFLFTVRRYALHGLSYRNSVCLSVRPSVKLVHCVHMVQPTIMISSPYGSPIILVSGDIKFIPKFEGGHPERGR